MFPPTTPINFLYPGLLEKRLGLLDSQVNIYSPDFIKFPDYKKALESAIVVTVNSGEYLYVPPLWWHGVESDCFNVGINYWFYPSKYHRTQVSKLVGCLKQLPRVLDPASSIADRERMSCYLSYCLSTGTRLDESHDFQKIPRNVKKQIEKFSHALRSLKDYNPDQLQEYLAYKHFFLEFLDTFFLTKSNQPYMAFPNITYHEMVSNHKKHSIRDIVRILPYRIKTFCHRLFSKRVL